MKKKLGKSGSMEVSVGMIVAMILGVLILGGGILLFTRASSSFEREYSKISELHESEVSRAMLSGSKASVYPTTANLERGESQLYTLGIRNDFQIGEDFVVFIIPSPSQADDNLITYNRRGVVSLDAGEVELVPFKIEVSKERGKTTYLFNVCAYPSSEAPAVVDYSCANTYAGVQKITINVR